MITLIFDIDGTIADSSHRKATLPCGSLDLEHWRENSKPELIERDKALPLLKVAQLGIQLGYHTVISTARVMTPACYQWLRHRGIDCRVYHRGLENNSQPDHVLKIEHFRAIFSSHRRPEHAIFFDDHSKNLEVAQAFGIGGALCANKYNTSAASRKRFNGALRKLAGVTA